MTTQLEDAQSSDGKQKNRVFISHCAEDVEIAQHLEELIQVSSNGFISTFRSTARGGYGIPAGVEWYEHIMGVLESSSSVIAIITPKSLTRPWVLYELGIARKIHGRVFGLVVGISVGDVTGPFSHFQNREANEHDTLDLILEVMRAAGGSPRQELVHPSVSAFLGRLQRLSRTAPPTTKPGPEAANPIAKPMPMENPSTRASMPCKPDTFTTENQPESQLVPVTLPEFCAAVRIRQLTPFGNMHITITVDPQTSRELEVFAQLGKGGDLANSDLEAICRMVSLWLRSGGSIQHVINQLHSIGSSLQVSTREGKIMSLGDGLARALKKYVEAKREFGLVKLLSGESELTAIK